MNTTFKTTQRTNKFVVALKKMEEAETADLDAMTETYGEQQGNLMMDALDFDDINRQILASMRVVILENLNENPTTI